MLSGRRFPPPWTVEDHNDARFITKDRNGCPLAYARQLATHNQETVRQFLINTRSQLDRASYIVGEDLASFRG